MSVTARIDLVKATSILASSGTLKYAERFGQPNAVEGSVALTDGNAANQGNVAYKNDFSIAASGTLFIDLRNGTGSPKDVLNNSLSLATVKAFVIEITSPADGKYLRLGPAGNSSGASLWFANNTQSETVHALTVKANPINGWSVSSGAGNICITNTGNQTIAGKIRIVGVGA